MAKNKHTEEENFSLFTQAEYARYIGKSRTWVSQLVKFRKVDVVHISGAILIKDTMLEEIL